MQLTKACYHSHPIHPLFAHMPKRSPCPVANVLDILGDKWTLLIIRDLFMGKQTYKEFMQSPEGITSNVLADRLKRLQKESLVNKQPYQLNPPRYHYQLTRKGKELGIVLKAMIRWGSKHIEGAKPLEDIMLEQSAP